MAHTIALAGKGGVYTVEKPAKDILSGETLCGEIDVAPYQVLVLEE
jgi:hypothetical protein